MCNEKSWPLRLRKAFCTRQAQAHIPGFPAATWVLWLPFSPEGMRVFVGRWVKIRNSGAVSGIKCARKTPSCWRLGCSWWSSSRRAARMGPEPRTSSPDFKSPRIAAHQAALIAVTQPWQDWTSKWAAFAGKRSPSMSLFSSTERIKKLPLSGYR